MVLYILTFLDSRREDKRLWTEWQQAFPEFNLLCFHIQRLYILFTESIYGFLMILRIRPDYFHRRHQIPFIKTRRVFLEIGNAFLKSI
jgi:hypothetical protein